MKSSLFLALLGSLSPLFATQTFLPPEEEAQHIIECGKQTRVHLSEGIIELTKGICDSYFDLTEVKKREKEEYTGEHIEYWENGQKKLSISFVNGWPEGHLHAWFENGDEAFKGHFYEGRKAGIHIAFWNRELGRVGVGRVARFFIYDEKGRYHGEVESKYFSGRLKTYLPFEHGKLHGNLQLYDESHKMFKKTAYRKGKAKKT